MATGVSITGSSGATAFDTAINTTLYGTKWSSTSLTYCFPNSTVSLPAYTTATINPTYFSPLTSAEQQEVVRNILASWRAVSGLTFTEVANTDPATRSTTDINIYWYMPIMLDEHGNPVLDQGHTIDTNPTAQVLDFPGDSPEAGDIQLGNAVLLGPTAPTPT